ncbi:hypothetical protein [Vibrio astriarenae]|uniref:hypothetical protein n=1 Tax=Vibrio astriarenae TaxID=1481923 RepID=UPI0037354E9E
MKQNILTLVTAIFAVGCTNNNQPGNSPIGDDVLKNTYYTNSFQPVQPFAFDKSKYAISNFSDDCSNTTDSKLRKTCWLNNLPNSEDYVFIADTSSFGELKYGTTGVSAKGGKYEIVSQWVRFMNVKPLDAEGAVKAGEDHKVGIGARIVATISTNEADINLGDLFAVAAAAERKQVTGSLLFTIQGIHGKGVDTYTPKVSKLDTENLLKALESIQNIKILLHNDESIEVTGQVVAIRSYPQQDIKNRSSLENSTSSGQGWIYVGHFDDKGKPLGVTNLVVSDANQIIGTLKTRTNVNVRSDYPDFPFYKLAPAINTVAQGKDVRIINTISTGNGKLWAFVDFPLN